jgi:hypothetical protein
MLQSRNSISSVLSTLGWTLTVFVIVSILLAVATLILGTLLLLIGRLLAQWFEVRVFEAAFIALGVAALVVFVFTRRVPTMDASKTGKDWDDEWDEDEDEEDDWDEEEDEDSQVIVPPRSRNDPCPCGSGKKYKYCHGRNA